ncbi:MULTISPECIES: anhydro-N-acetylmuramic acid kinase [Aequorivita]|uniref:Anhydro-N-acetylmuramic acid kinase n=1 Tax=Aequorivita iocasae TaxID=2803865 RepID=A0ABX7DSZ1_9FLAO|nr:MULTISPECIES: anhydro-N-acetylmuramic acid kinase [Aequorivita]QQX77204.1 anhydro-N-acetylmuramic acid kinase [Aequorivita iocasae]UCA56691.1 anhydro-N-acetylmuramic acid kinase [Aequorivita sp. F7]
MKKNKYHIIGVMSGTSLDGIDLAEILFDYSNGKWNFNILSAETVPYSSFWKDELREAINYSEEKLDRLDFKYTEKLSEEILKFIRKHNILEIDAVCSHGHTVLHQPEKGFTYQIGNLPRISKLLGQTVVCDFRMQDVELGGQGAPLVPIGDKLLFSEYDYCLNLGGFANCSFEKDGQRMAFDICPVNIVLNKYAEKLGKDFDEDGKLAASGNLDEGLLQKLNALTFYTEKPPKSLGLEWVREYIFPLLEASEISSEAILRTFTEHIAVQLANHFSEKASVLITGGGAYNSFLIDRLKNIASVEVVIPSTEILEYKEALIFGLLGVLKLRNEVNCLASVTGAKKDHSSGKIFNP